MDKKKLTSLINRVKRAKSSFSVMGDMLLVYEIDAMPIEDVATFHAALAAKGIEYKPLTKRQAA